MLSRFSLMPTRGSRWNYNIMGLDITMFVCGLSLTSATTVLPLFVHHLTTSNFALGLIQGVRTIGFTLPPIMIAGFTQRLQRKKPFLLSVTVFERIPYVALAIGSLALAHSHPVILLALFFVILLILGAAGGVTMPAWLDLIGETIPAEWRGRFFGLYSALGGLLGVLGAAVATAVLKQFPYPVNFAILFTLTFVMMVGSFIALCFCKDPVTPTPKVIEKQPPLWKAIPQIMRSDRNFRVYLAVRATLAAAGMATAFYVIDAEDALHLTDATAGAFAIITLSAATVGNAVGGYVGDHWGHKRVVEAGGVLLAIAALLAIVARHTSFGELAFSGVFLLSGLGTTAIQLTEFTFIVDFAPESIRPTYFGLAMIAESPFGVLGPIVGGVLADKAGYPLVYVVTTVLALAGATLALLVLTDPGINRSARGPEHVIEERLHT